MQSLLAAWRVSLHRTRADWPIVTAAGLIALLAATLLAAGPIYSNAVSEAGLHRLLESAPVEDANVAVTGTVPVAEAPATNDAVVRVLRETVGAAGVDVVASGESETFTLPGQDPDDVRDLAVLGFLQGVEDHATLVTGTWPETAAAGAPVQLAVLDSVAATLGIQAGDALELESRRGETVTLPATVVGIYRPIDPAEPYWWNDPALLEGLVESESYRTFGPFLTTPDDMLGRVAGGTVRLTWHGFPRIDGIAISELGPLQARLGQLTTRIDAALPGEFGTVTTGLPAILETSDRSLLVSRTGVLLLMAQLAILAAYAIALTADLIVDHRRLDTALMRSRGGGPLQVSALAFAEALLLAVPAGLLGPWLAAAALRLFNIAGPLAGIGLEIEPTITGDAYVAAAAAAIGCAFLLVLPTLFAARSYAAEKSGRARQETRNLGQRLGLDIALLAVTGIALWQLRLYGAPLTRSVQGSLGLDPLLVAAPAIGILAGSVVALRLIPLLATAADALTARGRTLVTSLGARQLARRPLRYTRAALLLMLAMSMGVFAVSYATTWGSSQRDQADFLVGADLRIDPLRGPGALPAWSLDTAYGGIAGVIAATPVERQSVRITQTAATGELLAVDAAAAGGVIHLRGDQTATDMESLLEPLVAGRPDPATAAIPGRPQQLLATATVSITELAALGPDPETGETVFLPLDVDALAGEASLGAVATVRDARGMLHRFPGPQVDLENGTQELAVPLLPGVARTRAAMTEAGATLAYPIQLVGMDVVVSLPQGWQATAGEITLDAVLASDAEDGSGGTPVDLAVAGAWQVGWSQGDGGAIAYAPAELATDDGIRFGPDAGAEEGGPFAALGGIDDFGRGVTVSFTPASILGLAATVLPAVVNRPFLESAAAEVGDRVTMPIGGTPRDVLIAGTLESFPTTTATDPAAVVDLPTLALLRFQANRGAGFPSEWWLDVDDASVTAAFDTATSGPFAGARVMGRVETMERLSADPLALAMIGALSLGSVVAALFAIIGLAVNAAVSARQRRTEFALLRALGLSPGQLSGWLWLENGSLVFVSLLAGTVLGLVIGWVVLPFVTVTQQAATPFPPVIVEVPWLSIIALEAASAIALALTLVVLTRIMRRSGLGSVLRMGED